MSSFKKYTGATGGGGTGQLSYEPREPLLLCKLLCFASPFNPNQDCLGCGSVFDPFCPGGGANSAATHSYMVHPYPIGNDILQGAGSVL
eukprot:231856-Amphidinium_carterae.1